MIVFPLHDHLLDELVILVLKLSSYEESNKMIHFIDLIPNFIKLIYLYILKSKNF